MQGSLASDEAVFRPLLKWPGGKGREWPEIAPLLPPRIRHFVDPFMGGGAPFAETPFEGRAWLNDRHERLVDIHRGVQSRDAEFLSRIEALGRSWEALASVSETVAGGFRDLVNGHRAGSIPGPASLPAMDEAGDAILASVMDKAGRIVRLERKHGVRFSDEELTVHGETAVRAGFYTFVRDRERTATGAAGAADFLFLREFCYGSMFRHNADGAFNIPYGGISYNRKSLLTRLDQYRSEATRAALARATFSCEDFEPFLGRLQRTLGPEDFVFADPPYDSEFRSYGPVAFGREDHRRLAVALSRLPCPWMLVIKETDFVRETYLARGARERHAFGKKYGYNVRGRNERETRHVVIGNP
jgi:DNA adenine methylase